VERNSVIGVRVGEAGTVLEMLGSVVRETSPDSDGNGGYGMQPGTGASVMVGGCLFSGNSSAGVSAWHVGTEVLLGGSLVVGTHPHSDGKLGLGVVSQSAGSMSLLNSLIAENSTAGVAAFTGGHLHLEASAVLNTGKGGAKGTSSPQVFGDGVLCANASEIDLVTTVVAGNGRNGVYFYKAPGSVTDSVVVDNEFYGLAMEACADQVEWEGMGNHILGNARALPSDKAAQVTTSTGGMPVPEAPQMICVPPECKE